MLRITSSITITESELKFKFRRASGPGGQGVNKLSTAVELRFDAGASPSFPAPVLARLRRLAGRRMTRAGIVIIDAKRFRTQERNRKDALDRLTRLLRRAVVAEKRRVATRPGAGERRRRLAAKLRRGETKRRRSPVAPDGD